MINENTFERLSFPLTDLAEGMSLFTLSQLRAIANRLIREDPVQDEEYLERLEDRFDTYLEESQEVIDEELSKAYLKGIKEGESEGDPSGTFLGAGLLIPAFDPVPISNKAQEILKKFPRHWDMYSIFKQASDEALENSKLPIVRQQRDRIRDLVIEASDETYRMSTTTTRRELSQQIMTRFADEGVNGIVYTNGRTMKLDSYAEMVARTQTGNASRQAQMNRWQEYGNDLVQISVHFPTSDLCEPHQGRVFSISGDSEYPSLDSAISDGLYHPNCKHTQSGYTEGVSQLPERDIDTEENREMYKAQERQRQIERNIRKYKRREATAVDPLERGRSKQYIKKWQKEARNNIESNKFLRRAYAREQI